MERRRAGGSDEGGLRTAPGEALEVATGVFAFVQPDGSWWINNAGFVAAPDAVVVVDTCATERRTRSFRAAIASRSTAPVRLVVNTHHHGDHTNGNCLFPEAAVLGRPACRDLVSGFGIGGLDAIWGPVDWGDLAVRPPEVTFDDRLTVFAGDRRIDLLQPAPVAHTTNDVGAWLPDDGVLFAGDLVFNGGTPFVLMGSITGSLDAIAWIRTLAPETIVPGHGPVCDTSVLDPIERYLRFVQDLAVAGRERGLTPLDAARGAELGEFAAWHDGERLAGNLHRAYADLEGRDVDLFAAFGDMLALNGGAPLRCLA